MNRKIIIGIVAVVIIVIGGVLILSFNDSEDEITRKVVEEEELEIDGKRVLKITTELWNPYMYEEGGEYKGLSFELLDRIMTELDVPYVFELVPWSRATKLAELGEADALLFPTYSEEREEYFYFTPEQIRYAKEGGKIPTGTLAPSEDGLFVKKFLAELFVFESFEQLSEADWKIGVIQDYVYSPAIMDADLDRVFFINDNAGFLALKEGAIDGFLSERFAGFNYLQELGFEDEMLFIGSDRGEGFAPGYLLFSKNSDYPNKEHLAREIGRVVAELKESGEYDEIVNKYVMVENE